MERGRVRAERIRQVLKESLGLPSSARSPSRFTASLRKDETAKTIRPTGVPEKGPGDGQDKTGGFAEEAKGCGWFWWSCAGLRSQPRRVMGDGRKAILGARGKQRRGGFRGRSRRYPVGRRAERRRGGDGHWSRSRQNPPRRRWRGAGHRQRADRPWRERDGRRPSPGRGGPR